MRLLGVWDLSGHVGPVYALACDYKRHTLFSGGADGIIAQWSCGSGKGAVALAHTPYAVYALWHVPQLDDLYIGETSGTIYIVNTAQKRLRRAIRSHSKAVMGLHSHPTLSEGWSTGQDGVFLYWDLEKAEPLGSVVVTPAGLRGFTLLARKDIFVCAGRDGYAYILGRAEPTSLHQLPLEDRPLFTAAAPTHENRVWVAGFSGKIYELDTLTWENTRTTEAHARTVNAMALHPSGQWLATASRDRQIHLWDLMTWERRLTLEGHQRSVNAILWLNPETLASAGDDGLVKLWHLEF